MSTSDLSDDSVDADPFARSKNDMAGVTTQNDSTKLRPPITKNPIC